MEAISITKKEDNEFKSDYKIPVIDISALVQNTDQDAKLKVASNIASACKLHGFFYISGHGISETLIQRLYDKSREFFAQEQENKMKIKMELGGRAWRGYFPIGGELTSGRPDWKEGLYFGQELSNDHALVQAQTPVHGSNLFPIEEEGDKKETLKQFVLEYIEEQTKLGHTLMRGIALSLGLQEDYFYSRYTQDPLVLFRIFNYRSQPIPEGMDVRWGVGEHTDYGLLTILYQDLLVDGLQVKVPGEGWVKAPPMPNTYVCNIGDMLDRMTGGLYRSTPHRVALNTSGRHRLSFPFFFDPNYFTTVQPIEGLPKVDQVDDSQSRWDKANVHAFTGTYGEYLLGKVGQVFPQLKQNVL